MQRYIFILFVLLCISNLQAAELRSWTGSNGKVIEAEFVSYDKDNEIVIIKRADGKEQRVKLSLFSDKDQEFAKNGGKENTDNPFSEAKNNVQEPLRIILNISEFGDCKYRIEKAKEAYKDDFVGEPITIPTNPKATVLKAKDGTLKWIHEFIPPRPRCRNFSFDEKTNVLTVSNGTFINPSFYFSFPMTIIFELSEYDGSACNIQLLGLHDNKTLHLELHFQSQSPLLIAKWMGWELVPGTTDQSRYVPLKTLHESAVYPLQDTLEGEFRMPVPNIKTTKRPMLIMRDVTNKISFSQIITKSRVSPNHGVGCDMNDSIVYIPGLSKEDYGYKSGIREGDVLKTIDKQKVESREQAYDLLQSLFFGIPHTIVVERAGNTIPIEIK